MTDYNLANDDLLDALQEDPDLGLIPQSATDDRELEELLSAVPAPVANAVNEELDSELAELLGKVAPQIDLTQMFPELPREELEEAADLIRSGAPDFFDAFSLDAGDIPFTGVVSDVADAVRLNEASKNWSSGAATLDEQRLVLDELVRETRGEGTFGNQVLEGAKGVATLSGEFLVGAGVGSLVTRGGGAAARAGVKALSGRVGGSIAAQASERAVAAATKFATSTLGAGAAALTSTVALQEGVPRPFFGGVGQSNAYAVKRLFDDLEMAESRDTAAAINEQIANLMNPGMFDLPNAKGFAELVMMNTMEMTVGAGLRKAVGGAKGFAVKQVPPLAYVTGLYHKALEKAIGGISQRAPRFTKAMRVLQDLPTFNGILEELAEEYIQNVTSEAIFGDDWRDGLPEDLEEVAVMAASFGVLPIAGFATKTAVNSAAKVGERVLQRREMERQRAREDRLQLPEGVRPQEDDGTITVEQAEVTEEQYQAYVQTGLVDESTIEIAVQAHLAGELGGSYHEQALDQQQRPDAERIRAMLSGGTMRGGRRMGGEKPGGRTSLKRRVGKKASERFEERLAEEAAKQEYEAERDAELLERIGANVEEFARTKGLSMEDVTLSTRVEAPAETPDMTNEQREARRRQEARYQVFGLGRLLNRRVVFMDTDAEMTPSGRGAYAPDSDTIIIDGRVENPLEVFVHELVHSAFQRVRMVDDVDVSAADQLEYFKDRFPEMYRAARARYVGDLGAEEARTMQDAQPELFEEEVVATFAEMLYQDIADVLVESRTGESMANATRMLTALIEEADSNPAARSFFGKFLEMLRSIAEKLRLAPSRTPIAKRVAELYGTTPKDAAAQARATMDLVALIEGTAYGDFDVLADQEGNLRFAPMRFRDEERRQAAQALDQDGGAQQAGIKALQRELEQDGGSFEAADHTFDNVDVAAAVTPGGVPDNGYGFPRLYSGGPLLHQNRDDAFLGSGEGTQQEGRGQYLTSFINIGRWYADAYSHKGIMRGPRPFVPALAMLRRSIEGHPGVLEVKVTEERAEYRKLAQQLRDMLSVATSRIARRSFGDILGHSLGYLYAVANTSMSQGVANRLDIDAFDEVLETTWEKALETMRDPRTAQGLTDITPDLIPGLIGDKEQLYVSPADTARPMPVEQISATLNRLADKLEPLIRDLSAPVLPDADAVREEDVLTAGLMTMFGQYAVLRMLFGEKNASDMAENVRDTRDSIVGYDRDGVETFGLFAALTLQGFEAALINESDLGKPFQPGKFMLTSRHRRYEDEAGLIDEVRNLDPASFLATLLESVGRDLREGNITVPELSSTMLRTSGFLHEERILAPRSRFLYLNAPLEEQPHPENAGRVYAAIADLLTDPRAKQFYEDDAGVFGAAYRQLKVHRNLQRDLPEMFGTPAKTVKGFMERNYEHTDLMDVLSQLGYQVRKDRDLNRRRKQTPATVRAQLISDALLRHGIRGYEYYGNQKRGPYLNFVALSSADVAVVRAQELLQRDEAAMTEGARVAMQVNVSMNRDTIPGLARLNREAIQGGRVQHAQVSLLNDLMNAAINDVLGDIPHTSTTVPLIGVYQGEMEVAHAVHLNIASGQVDKVIDRVHRLGVNFDQDSVHILEPIPDQSLYEPLDQFKAPRPDISHLGGRGEFVTPVVTIDLGPDAEQQGDAAIQFIDKIMREVGLDALTYNPATPTKRGSVSAYYAGNPRSEEDYVEWTQRIDAAASRIGGDSPRVRTTLHLLHTIGQPGSGESVYLRDQGRLPLPTNPDLRRNRQSLIYRTAERFYYDVVGGAAPFAIFGGHSGLSWDKQQQNERAVTVKDYFQRMAMSDMANPMVSFSYGWLCREMAAQFDELPVRVVARRYGPNDKRPSSADIRRMIRQDNLLEIELTEPESHGPEGATFDMTNPLLHYSSDAAVEQLAENGYGVSKDNPASFIPQPVEAVFVEEQGQFVGKGRDASSVRRDSTGRPLLFNDCLRAVHDYFAHGITGNNFVQKGEEGARRTHLLLTRNAFAAWALMTETYGQNSWVNARKEVQDKAPRDRGFADQKVGLLPLPVAMIRGNLRRIPSEDERRAKAEAQGRNFNPDGGPRGVNPEGAALAFDYAQPESLPTQLLRLLADSKSIGETVGLRSRAAEANRALLRLFEKPNSSAVLKREMKRFFAARKRREGETLAEFDRREEEGIKGFLSGMGASPLAVDKEAAEIRAEAEVVQTEAYIDSFAAFVHSLPNQTILKGELDLQHGTKTFKRAGLQPTFADVLRLKPFDPEGSQTKREWEAEQRKKLDRMLFDVMAEGVADRTADAEASQAKDPDLRTVFFPQALRVAAFELAADQRMLNAVGEMQHIAAEFGLRDGPAGSFPDSDPAQIAANMPTLKYAPYRNGRARFDNGPRSKFDPHVLSTASVRGKGGDRRMTRRLIPSIKAYHDEQRANVASYLRLRPFIKQAKLQGTDEQVINEAVRTFRKNALFLYDLYPEELRERARQWYVGGNKLCNEMGQRFNVSVPMAAAIMAAHSPQTEWMVNVARAEQTIDMYQNHRDERWGPGVAEWANAYTSKDKQGNITYPYRKDGVLDVIQNKTLRELIAEAVEAERAAAAMPVGPTLKDPLTKARDAAIRRARAWNWRNAALWARAYAHFTLREDYDVYTPEGDAVGLVVDDKGNVRRMGFMGLTPIWKGFRMLEQGGSVEVIDEELGEGNKVRSFYMNLLFPNDMYGEVTNDTHNIAALSLMPLGASADLVGQGLSGGSKKKEAQDRKFWADSGVEPFGTGSPTETGVQGLYAVFADAIREAAHERGVLPREMQSIVWEAVRGLMEKRKSAARKKDASEIWSRYQRGTISLPEAQRRIFGLFPGIDFPAWDGRNLRVVDTNGTIAVIEDEGAAMAGAGNRPGAVRTGGASVARTNVPGLSGGRSDAAGDGGRGRARRSSPLRQAPARTLRDFGFSRAAVTAQELADDLRRFDERRELDVPTASVGVLTFNVSDLQTMPGVNDEKLRFAGEHDRPAAELVVVVAPTGESFLQGELPDDADETAEAAVEWYGGAERGDGDWGARAVAKKSLGPDGSVGAPRLRSARGPSNAPRRRLGQGTARERAAALSRELIRRGETLPPVSDPASTGLVPEQPVEEAPVTASGEQAPGVQDEPILQPEPTEAAESATPERRPQAQEGAGGMAAPVEEEPAGATQAPRAGGLFPSEADETAEQQAIDAELVEPTPVEQTSEQATGVPAKTVRRDDMELNNPGSTAEQRALWQVVDADRAAQMEDIVGGESAEELARQSLEDDYDGTRARIETKLQNGEKFAPFEHRALAHIINGLFMKALNRKLSPEERRKALEDGRELGVAFREMRGQVAKELGATVGLGMTAKEETLLMLMQLPAEEARRRAKIVQELKGYLRPEQLGPQGQYVQTNFGAARQQGSEFDLRNAPDFNQRGQVKTQERIDELLRQKAEIDALDAIRYERAAKALEKAGYDAFIQEDPDALLDPQHGHIIRNIISSAKATYTEKAMELRQSMLLTGLFTHKVNLYGNTGMLALNGPVQRLVEGLVADTLRAFGRDVPNAPSTREIVPYLMGGVRAVPQAVSNFFRAIRTEGPIFEIDLKREGTAFGEYTQRYDTANGVKIAGKKGKAARLFSFSLLLGMDELFKTIAGGMAASGLAWRQAYEKENLRGEALQRRVDELLADKTHPLWTEALYFAREVTFQDEGGEASQAALGALNKLTDFLDRASQLVQLPLGTIAQKLGVEGANRDQNIYLPLGVLLVPFRKVPLRIPAQALRRSPIGPPVMMAKALAAKEYKGDTALLVRDIADGFIAMGVMMMVLQALDDDDETALPILTGSRAATKGERETQYRTAPPESIRLGDTYYQYSRLDPIGTTLVMVVDAVEEYRRSGATEALSKGVASLLSTMKDKTVLKSLGDVLYTIEQARRGTEASEETVAKLLRSLYVTPWVPNLIRQTARETQESYQMPRTIVEDGYPAFLTDDFFDTDGEPIATGLTGVAPAIKRDLWGRPVRRVKGDGLSSSFLVRLVQPAKVQQLVDDVSPIDVALVTANERVQAGELTDVDQYFPTLPQRKYTVQLRRDGKWTGESEVRRMTNPQYSAFLRDSGQAAHKALLDLVDSDANGYQFQFSEDSNAGELNRLSRRVRKHVLSKLRKRDDWTGSFNIDDPGAAELFAIRTAKNYAYQVVRAQLAERMSGE